MSNHKQSNTDYVSIQAVSFMDAYCKTNLSQEQIKQIGVIFDLLLSNAPAGMRKDKFRELMRKHYYEIRTPSTIQSIVGPVEEDFLVRLPRKR